MLTYLGEFFSCDRLSLIEWSHASAQKYGSILNADLPCLRYGQKKEKILTTKSDTDQQYFQLLFRIHNDTKTSKCLGDVS